MIRAFVVGMCVKLHTEDEWNNLYGVIDEINDLFLTIFCINKPGQRYFVKLNDGDDNILEIIRFGG